MLNRRNFAFSLVTAASFGQTAPVYAQTYPSKPIRLVIPFTAGGATDVLGRLLGNALSGELGVPVIIENKPGASTMIGASAVAASPADGYTLLLAGTSTFSINPVIRMDQRYDVIKSFTQVAQIADMTLILVASTQAPGKTLPELLAAAKANPSGFSYGTFGQGTSVHFGAEMLSHASGVKMVHVPFNGSAQDLIALVGHQLQLSFETLVASQPLIKAGKIRPIAILSEKRSPLLPDIPTVAESGFPGFAVPSWFSVAGPANLPTQVRSVLEKALASAVQKPEIRSKMLDLGLTPVFASGPAVTARIEQELSMMRAVASRANIKAN